MPIQFIREGKLPSSKGDERLREAPAANRPNKGLFFFFSSRDFSHHVLVLKRRVLGKRFLPQYIRTKIMQSVLRLIPETSVTIPHIAAPYEGKEERLPEVH